MNLFERLARCLFLTLEGIEKLCEGPDLFSYAVQSLSSSIWLSRHVSSEVLRSLLSFHTDRPLSAAFKIRCPSADLTLFM